MPRDPRQRKERTRLGETGEGTWKTPRKWARAEKAEDWRKKELERLNCTKYHYLKFVERQKVERKMKSCKKRLTEAQAKGQEEQVKELQQTLRQHLLDHEYIRHYPKHLPYNSLFPVQDSEASQKRRAEIRKMIREQLEKEGGREPSLTALEDAAPKEEGKKELNLKATPASPPVPKKGKKIKKDLKKKVLEAEPEAIEAGAPSKKGKKKLKRTEASEDPAPPPEGSSEGAKKRKGRLLEEEEAASTPRKKGTKKLKK